MRNAERSVALLDRRSIDAVALRRDASSVDDCDSRTAVPPRSASVASGRRWSERSSAFPRRRSLGAGGRSRPALNLRTLSRCRPSRRRAVRTDEPARPRASRRSLLDSCDDTDPMTQLRVRQDRQHPDADRDRERRAGDDTADEPRPARTHRRLEIRARDLAPEAAHGHLVGRACACLFERRREIGLDLIRRLAQPRGSSCGPSCWPSWSARRARGAGATRRCSPGSRRCERSRRSAAPRSRTAPAPSASSGAGASKDRRAGARAPSSPTGRARARAAARAAAASTAARSGGAAAPGGSRRARRCDRSRSRAARLRGTFPGSDRSP